MLIIINGSNSTKGFILQLQMQETGITLFNTRASFESQFSCEIAYETWKINLFTQIEDIALLSLQSTLLKTKYVITLIVWFTKYHMYCTGISVICTLSLNDIFMLDKLMVNDNTKALYIYRKVESSS